MPVLSLTSRSAFPSLLRSVPNTYSDNVSFNSPFDCKNKHFNRILASTVIRYIKSRLKQRARLENLTCGLLPGEHSLKTNLTDSIASVDLSGRERCILPQAGTAGNLPLPLQFTPRGLPMECPSKHRPCSPAHISIQKNEKVETHDDKIKFPFPGFFESLTSHNEFRRA